MTVYFLIGLLIVFLGCGLVTILKRKPPRGGVESLISEFISNNEAPKTPQEVINSESFMEYLRISSDHSLEKKYIRFCLDELTEYPSGYVLTLKESEPLPDYSEKGLMEVPSFRDVCAKIKDLAKLGDCDYIDPKMCKLPFFSTGFEGFHCDLNAELCDGVQEPYVSFWIKRDIS